MTIKDYCTAAHKNAVDKKFYTKERSFIELVALTITELAEAIEADRKGRFAADENMVKYFADEADWSLPETAERFREEVKDCSMDEISDTFIHLFSLVEYYGIDIEKYIKAKMKFNKTRPELHGKKY